ncbi:MAG TPA: alpha/beta hydrolase, partial [Mycobacterium sp.]|nr:alpha/beta hydrolase [Mycobacterium sp.]
MSPTRRFAGVARKATTWTLVAAIAVAVASCGRLVEGQAKMAMPKVGAPIAWDRCSFTTNDLSRLLASAQCGKLGVPLDYSKPDGESISIAVIKFPASGAKIGSLVINPGGPGESGVNAAVGMAQNLPDELHERFDLVGFDPRGVRFSKPALWCNSDADNDAMREDPMVDYSPAGVAHIEQ